VDIIIVRKAAFPPKRSLAFMAGASGLGAGLAYWFDPYSGRRRRALLRDQVVHTRHTAEDMALRAAVDLKNRAVGSVAAARAHLHDEPPDDRVLAERVRSALGRRLSHPGAVRVEAKDGVVTLQGPVLQRESRAALTTARSVHGVQEVNDQLDRHRTAEDVPALQGAGKKVMSPSPLLQESWPPATRLLASLAGGALLVQAARTRGMARIAMVALGGLLTGRALTNLPFRRLFGVGAGRRAIDIRKDIHIARPPEEVFAFCRNFEALPCFMSHVRSVEQTGDNRYHWEASGPAGISVRWDAEITLLEDNRVLAWKSTPDSHLEQAGVLRVDPENGGTRLQIRMAYNPLGGAMGHAVASLFNADPKHALDADLLRLKSLLETGKATAHGHTVTRDELNVPHQGGE
jgi:uncharacterized membrane protein